MMDQHMLCDDGFENVVHGGQVTGFSLLARLPYYRGLGLSMVEDLKVSIDGQDLPREAISFDEGPGPLTLDEMETAFDRRWPFGAPATITVTLPGGFPKGEHTLALQQRLRISYLPFPAFNNDQKLIRLG